MDESQTLGCSLSPPQLVERLDEWREVTARATAREVENGRIVATYPNDPQLVGRLRELIDAEAGCCASMDFSVEERPDEVVVELRVPDEMAEAVATVLGLVAAEGGGLEPPSPFGRRFSRPRTSYESHPFIRC